MSNERAKYTYLPKLQRRIVLKLAEKGAMNIRKTNSLLKGEYTSTNRAFHELKAKEFIQVVNKQIYRKRQFPLYWLTDKGIIYALIQGEKPDLLLTYAERYYPNKPLIQLLIKLTQVLGSKALMFSWELIRKHGLTEKSISTVITMGLMYSRQFTTKEPETLVKQIVKVLKSYPEFYNLYKKEFRQIKQGISEITKIIEEE